MIRSGKRSGEGSQAGDGGFRSLRRSRAADADPAVCDQVKSAAGAVRSALMNRQGMEMVQVAILIALAVALGIIFRTEITRFVNNTFSTLNS